MAQNSVSARQNSNLRDNVPIFVTEDTELEVGSQNVFATANTASDSFTITLPPVGPSAGTIISIDVTIADAKDVQVEDNRADAGLPNDLDMDADADNVVLYSTGVLWIELFNGIA